MRSELHSRRDPQQVLAQNLSSIFAKRKLSARGVAKAIGGGLSNKTVSNLLNGVGAPQLDKLIAVAKHIHVPLWQLLCPGIETSHFGDETVHDLVESFCSISEIGRARFLQNLEDTLIAERVKHPRHSQNAT